MQNTCVIIGACPVSSDMLSLIPQDAFVIAADAGWQRAADINLRPDIIIGDFDSAPPPENRAEVLCLPAEKDDTDTNYAVNYALEKGFRNFVLLGALGGRLDHSMANIQSLMHITASGAKGIIADANTEIRCVMSSFITLEPKPDSYLSVFAMGGTAKGVTLKYVKYPLENAVLRPDYPLGVSNEFTSENAILGCREGTLIVMTVRKNCL